MLMLQDPVEPVKPSGDETVGGHTSKVRYWHVIYWGTVILSDTVGLLDCDIL